MKFPLFLRRSDLAARAAQEHAEKLLAESLRLLGQCCAKLADALEAQRLARAGYREQGEFLKRVDRSGAGQP